MWWVVTGDVQNVNIMILRTIDLIAEQSIPFLRVHYLVIGSGDRIEQWINLKKKEP